MAERLTLLVDRLQTPIDELLIVSTRAPGASPPASALVSSTGAKWLTAIVRSIPSAFRLKLANEAPALFTSRSSFLPRN